MDRLAQISVWVTLVAIAVALSGCSAIGGIFKAGVWTGVILIVVVVLLIVGVLSFMRRT